jgi:uncharacterized membrane-anchored protein YitT (DUF2179 family)
MSKAMQHFLKILYKYVFLLAGSAIAAVGLEIFLIPNNIIDGGIVGISIILSYMTDLPLGVFTFVLNIPFLFIGYKQIGKSFLLQSLFSVTTFSVLVSLLHPIPGLTNDILLATVFGGIILGAGVGVILRFGGSLDGTEIIAIILNKRSSLSVGQIVMGLNVIIFSCAALVLGWDRALYSMLAYFVAHKAIDIVVEGFDEAKAVTIISAYPEKIAEAVKVRLGRSVTFWEGVGSFSGENKNIIYSVVTRLEVSKLRSIITDIDENAFVTVHDISEVMSGKDKKRSIH